MTAVFLAVVFLFVSTDKIRAADPVLGEQKVAYILVEFQDKKFDPVWVGNDLNVFKNKIKNFLDNELAPYYAETSYNKINVTADVFGVYTLPINETCLSNNIISEGMKAADPDIYYPNYSRVIVLSPDICGWGGMSDTGRTPHLTNDGTVNLSGTALKEAFATTLFVVLHELGHGLGLIHANFLDCGNVTWGSSCTTVEYGDPFDAMASGSVFQYDASHKEYLGWFDTTNIFDVKSSGSYFLEPIENKSAGLKALKIQRSRSDYLYVEYRQPIGYDKTLPVGYSASNIYQGALLHTLASLNGSLLLDASPLDNNVLLTLLPGSSFTDPNTQTKISVSSANATGLSLSVVAGKTDFEGPIVTITAPTTGSIISGNTTVTASVSDASGISKIEFRIQASGVGQQPQIFQTVTAAPYQASLDTTRYGNGTYSINAIAYDNAGTPFGLSNNLSLSNSANVTINNTTPTCTPGDANGDKSINISDVQTCINVILSTDTNQSHKTCSDMNGDSNVNITDCQAIINKILNP